MDVEADGLFDEFFGDTEPVGQLPQLRAALGDGIVQLVHGQELPDGPFVRPVFVTAAVVHGGIAVIEAAGDAMAQLMAQMDPLLNGSVPEPGVHADEAAAPVVHIGQGAGLLQRKGDHRDVLLGRDIVQRGQFHGRASFPEL